MRFANSLICYQDTFSDLPSVQFNSKYFKQCRIKQTDGKKILQRACRVSQQNNAKLISQPKLDERIVVKCFQNCPPKGLKKTGM